MTDLLYEVYVNARQSISKFEKHQSKDNEICESELELVEHYKNQIRIIEDGYPEIKRRYERNKAIQESFTYEQVDFICYQIGEWYVTWKNKITIGDGHGHHLGFAKEQLKTMICGD